MANTNSKVYHSFAGVDIHAVFNDTVFGELQMVSYHISREKAPVYTMGYADMRTIARGKRTVVGKCIFVVFDRDSLVESMNQTTSKPYLNNNEVANRNGDASTNAPAGGSYDADVGTLNKNDVNTIRKQASARLADQLLPFDITLVAANEYGQVSKMIIYGVELMNESSGVSIDDLVIEKQMDFIARSVSPWTPVA